MTENKHERDGESFIVSDGVNLDELDLENMVRNEVTVPEILQTQYARAPSIESIPGMIPKIHQTQERIWLEITLDIDGTVNTFPGYVEKQKTTPYVKSWQLRMDRESAAHLMMVIADSNQHSDRSALCVQLKWCYGESERVMKLDPPSDIQMFDAEDISDSDLFVKVNFEISKS